MAIRKSPSRKPKTTSKSVRPATSKSIAPAKKSVNTKSSPTIRIKDLIPAIIIVVIIALLGVFKNQFVVATVNGHQISRIQLMRELEKKDGKTVLEGLISQQLVTQEAEKRHVSVSQNEVNDQVGKIEKSVKAQGQNLDLLLAQQSMTRQDLTDQVKLQLLLKKMVGDTTVSDKEVNDYLDKNKDSIPEGSNPDQLKTQIKQQLEQQKLNEKIQNFVGDLQKKAKIENLLPL